MELLTLHALRDRDRFRMLRGSVPTEMLGLEAQLILGWYERYFEVFKDQQTVDVQGLIGLIKLRSGYDVAQMTTVMHIVGQLQAPYDERLIAGIVHQLQELDFSGKLAALNAQFQSGGEVELGYEIFRMSQAHMRAMGASAPTDYIQTDVLEILKKEAGDVGVKLPTLALQTHVKGLRGGASALVAAPPDAGKTSFLANVAATAAPQLPQYFDPRRPILWLNNEGPGERIIPRLYQAVLGVSLDQLVKWGGDGSLHHRYTEALGGDPERIRVKDFHGGTLAQAEQIIDQMEPCMVIWDMMANVKHKSSTAGSKTDLLEEMWQEARESACRNDYISMGTIQVSVEGRNMLFPPQQALKDSKTAVQGAVDLQIHLGVMDGAAYADIRGISTPKNKYQMPGRPSCIEAQLGFDAANCRFIDGEMMPNV